MCLAAQILRVAGSDRQPAPGMVLRGRRAAGHFCSSPGCVFFTNGLRPAAFSTLPLSPFPFLLLNSGLLRTLNLKIPTHESADLRLCHSSNPLEHHGRELRQRGIRTED